MPRLKGEGRPPLEGGRTVSARVEDRGAVLGRMAKGGDLIPIQLGRLVACIGQDQEVAFSIGAEEVVLATSWNQVGHRGGEGFAVLTPGLSERRSELPEVLLDIVSSFRTECTAVVFCPSTGKVIANESIRSSESVHADLRAVVQTGKATGHHDEPDAVAGSRYVPGHAAPTVRVVVVDEGHEAVRVGVHAVLAEHAVDPRDAGPPTGVLANRITQGEMQLEILHTLQMGVRRADCTA